MYLTTDRANEIERIPRSSNHQITWCVKANACLVMWKIHFGFYRNVRAHLMQVPGYSDDRDPGNLVLRVAEFESFAEHFLTSPVLTRHRLVNDCNRLRLLIVGRFESSSTNNRNSHRFQVTRTDLTMIRIVREPALFRLLESHAFRIETSRAAFPD